MEEELRKQVRFEHRVAAFEALCDLVKERGGAWPEIKADFPNIYNSVLEAVGGEEAVLIETIEGILPGPKALSLKMCKAPLTDEIQF